jgi:O-antigen ligase
MFRKLPLTNKLFGVGPDCYTNYAYEFNSAEMRARWGEKVLANAHNEWLNTMFTLGIIGLASYAGFFAVSFISFISRKRAYAMSIAAAAVIAAYTSHNFFCYQQVLCTPYVFAIIGLCTAFEKNNRRRKASVYR